MTHAVQWIRSLIFNVQMYVALLPFGLFWLIPQFSRAVRPCWPVAAIVGTFSGARVG